MKPATKKKSVPIKLIVSRVGSEVEFTEGGAVLFKARLTDNGALHVAAFKNGQDQPIAIQPMGWNTVSLLRSLDHVSMPAKRPAESHGVKVATARMDASQSRDVNKKAFVSRLVAAGWTRKDAAAEYELATAEGE